MASHRDLLIEWNMLDSDESRWDGEDLHLAASIGRTLLERNEELENEVKQQQGIIEEREREIEFLTRTLSSLRSETNDRAKVYEQLELSISDLEKTNKELQRKSEQDKKRIRSLCENIDYLEKKCEELNASLEKMRKEEKKNKREDSVINELIINRSCSYIDRDDDPLNGFFGNSNINRSRSLQDLRDYDHHNNSPLFSLVNNDDFFINDDYCDYFSDSGKNSSNNSPTTGKSVLMIESLEQRIEELLSLNEKEREKVKDLEEKIQVFTEENAKLLNQVANNEEDNNNIPPFYTSTRRNSDASMKSCSPNASATYCKRCTAEIQMLNLVNSIEHEDDEYFFEEFYDECSSLERELELADHEANSGRVLKNSFLNEELKVPNEEGDGEEKLESSSTSLLNQDISNVINKSKFIKLPEIIPNDNDADLVTQVEEKKPENRSLIYRTLAFCLFWVVGLYEFFWFFVQFWWFLVLMFVPSRLRGVNISSPSSSPPSSPTVMVKGMMMR